ncbi:hypothetical protein ElyMa_006897100 [Elysia marginata]|uniref:Uncharacterized protein n=1 Tax=Elysia marginata TaxID=1093978 RepID=A0AAV4JFW4_9GAST|nr:hypothetical protein ElyMa_006897100 [Elysia marginata]
MQPNHSEAEGMDFTRVITRLSRDMLFYLAPYVEPQETALWCSCLGAPVNTGEKPLIIIYRSGIEQTVKGRESWMPVGNTSCLGTCQAKRWDCSTCDLLGVTYMELGGAESWKLIRLGS